MGPENVMAPAPASMITVLAVKFAVELVAIENPLQEIPPPKKTAFPEVAAFVTVTVPKATDWPR